MKKIKIIIICGLLLASAIVINRFLKADEIGTAVKLAGILLGWKYSLIIAALTDLIGALLFPFGAYFVGYTISSALTGLVYGLLLYRKGEFKVDKKFMIRLIISILIVCIFINGGLNTLWLVLTSKKAFLAILPTRVIKQLLMIPIMFLTITGLTKLLTKQINEVKND